MQDDVVTGLILPRKAPLKLCRFGNARNICSETWWLRQRVPASPTYTSSSHANVVSYLYVTQDGRATVRHIQLLYIGLEWCSWLCYAFLCSNLHLIPDEVVRNTMKMRALKGRQTRTANNTHWGSDDPTVCRQMEWLLLNGSEKDGFPIIREDCTRLSTRWILWI